MSVNRLHEGLSDQEVLALLNSSGSLSENGQVLGHVATLNSGDDGSFESLSEQSELFILVKLGSVQETTSPCENGSNWVG